MRPIRLSLPPSAKFWHQFIRRRRRADRSPLFRNSNSVDRAIADVAPAKGTIRFVGTGSFLSAVPSTSSALEDGAGDDLPGGGPPLPGANHDFQGEASLTTSQGAIFRCLT